MTHEELVALGVAEDIAPKILALHKKAIDGVYVPKVTFEAERTKVKELGEQVATRDTQIAELGKFKGTAEELTTKVATLETENATAKTNYENSLKEQSEKAAIRFALIGKVIDPEDVVDKIDRTKLVFDNDKVKSGLDDQLTELKKAKPHFFPAEKEESAGSNGFPKGWIFGDTPPDGADQNDGKTNNTDPAAAFGATLAKMGVTSQTAAQKAAEHYFK